MHRSIQKKITINSSPANVWHVFINPVVTRQMGGEYVSDWKAGGSIGWKGRDGAMYTRGTILAISPEKILKHEIHDLNDPKVLLSTITYKFEANNGVTEVEAEEELNYPTTDEQYEEISEGWDFALNAIKDIAEKLP